MNSDLQRLWNECFPQDADFFAFFADRIYKRENAVFVTELDGTLSAMAHLIPQKVCGANALYIFAVGTLKDYRGRGYCADLMSRVPDVPQFLIPQEPSLFDFYARFGFKPAFFQGGFSASESGRPAKTSDIPALNALYQGHTERDSDMWRNILEVYQVRVWDGGYAVCYDGECREAFGSGTAVSGEKRPYGMAKNFAFDTDNLYVNLLYN